MAEIFRDSMQIITSQLLSRYAILLLIIKLLERKYIYKLV